MTTLDVPISRLKASGQVVDKTPGATTAKSDGHSTNRWGIADNDANWSILTAAQYSGSTNVTVNAKTDARSNACVFDQVTGLMWTRTAAATVGPAGNGLLYWYDATNGEDCFTYCDAANAAQLAGHADWRIPNMVEILSLALWKTGGAAPFVNQTAFPAMTTSYVWAGTSTPVTPTTNAMEFSFNVLTAGISAKTSTTAQLLLVRSGL